jgi:alkyl hydroperoxide reductase subunit F
MLDTSIKEQVRNIFASLDGEYIFNMTLPSGDKNSEEMRIMLTEIAECSDKISCRIDNIHPDDAQQLKFTVLKNGKETGITFRGIPNGHEFSSLLMAILNSDGKGKNIPDEGICKRIASLKGPISLSTYVSLTCTNCPDVVQSLNLMSILNDNISHEMVDGALFQEEAGKLNIQAVPSVYADGELLHVGKAGFGELIDKLEARYGHENKAVAQEAARYDVIVIGGGPSGCSSAIYSARKGLRVAIIADRIGGQVTETVGIENLISIPYTTGEELAANLKAHARKYAIDIFEHRRVEKLDIDKTDKTVLTSAGEMYIAPAVIIATGASWRKLNVPGETEYIGKGVAFCPHCDGPFYKGKHVAVIGGGNSGIEAAIDLAGICSKVTVFEFLDELKADKVLQSKLTSLPNVETFLASQTVEVIGNGKKVTGIKVKDRKSGDERIVDLDGIFVQIGLAANSAPFKDTVSVNRAGEIEIDGRNRTNIPGIYAAGDVTTVPFKQIIIAMGEGAKAALSAFEDRIRGN